MCRLVLLAMLALSLAGCDPTYLYLIWNDTAQPIIAETHHDVVEALLVEPGAYATAALNIGGATDAFRMDIYDGSCSLLGSVRLETDVGVVHVMEGALTYVDTTDGVPVSAALPTSNPTAAQAIPACGGT